MQALRRATPALAVSWPALRCSPRFSQLWRSWFLLVDGDFNYFVFSPLGALIHFDTYFSKGLYTYNIFTRLYMFCQYLATWSQNLCLRLVVNDPNFWNKPIKHIKYITDLNLIDNHQRIKGISYLQSMYKRPFLLYTSWVFPSDHFEAT